MDKETKGKTSEDLGDVILGLLVLGVGLGFVALLFGMAYWFFTGGPR